MTTSNSTDFTLTRDQIITQALNLLGVYGQGDTVSPNDISFSANALNMMVKAWEGQGIHLWTSSEAALFLTLGQQKYSMKNTASDVTGDYPIFNILTNNSSGNSISVTSTVGITINDNIGIKLDSNIIQWTTVSAIPTSTTLTLAASLTSSASSGNSVFSFTTRTDRPLEITSARYRYGRGVERPITKKGRDDFMRVSQKSTTGKANQFFYTPKVSDSWLYMWPTADDVGDCITFSYVRRIQDFDSSTDAPDLPQEWLEAIVYNLAIRLAPGFGIATAKLSPDLVQVAQASLVEMQLWDSEEGSLNIVPNYRYDY